MLTRPGPGHACHLFAVAEEEHRRGVEDAIGLGQGLLGEDVYLSNLEVSNVDFKKYYGEITVDLKGTYVRSGDRCDDSRVRAQVWSTVRQFPEVKKVNIFLNGNLLGDILATGK